MNFTIPSQEASHPNIRTAKRKDTAAVTTLYAAAVAKMQAQGLDQWDDLYPGEALLGQDIQKGEMFLLVEDNAVAAAVVVNGKQDKEYESGRWAGAAPALVVHRLCVHPQYQKAGKAATLMRWVEKYAKAKGYASIRLDAFTKNAASLALYQKLGYREAGKVTFRKGVCILFEKGLADEQNCLTIEHKET